MSLAKCLEKMICMYWGGILALCMLQILTARTRLSIYVIVVRVQRNHVLEGMMLENTGPHPVAILTPRESASTIEHARRTSVTGSASGRMPPPFHPVPDTANPPWRTSAADTPVSGDLAVTNPSSQGMLV
jgi:hypothetical protein